MKDKMNKASISYLERAENGLLSGDPHYFMIGRNPLQDNALGLCGRGWMSDIVRLAIAVEIEGERYY